jgi:hypothetical protein
MSISVSKFKTNSAPTLGLNYVPRRWRKYFGTHRYGSTSHKGLNIDAKFTVSRLFRSSSVATNGAKTLRMIVLRFEAPRAVSSKVWFCVTGWQTQGFTRLQQLRIVFYYLWEKVPIRWWCSGYCRLGTLMFNQRLKNEICQISTVANAKRWQAFVALHLVIHASLFNTRKLRLQFGVKNTYRPTLCLRWHFRICRIAWKFQWKFWLHTWEKHAMTHIG